MNTALADLNVALQVLEIAPNQAAGLRHNWREHMLAFNPEKLCFLEPDFLTDICRRLNISSEVTQWLLKGRHLFENAPVLRKLAWHCHLLLKQACGGRAAPEFWPKIPRALGAPKTLFYAYPFLSVADDVMRQHAQRDVPADITLDTLADFEIWVREYYHRHGTPGLEEINWLVNHFTGKLFKLGRLQFNFEFWEYDFHVFRHRTSGSVIMLAGHNLAFREDGQFCDADNTTAEPAWQTDFYEARPGIMRGWLVDPCGHALREQVELSLSEWAPILRLGDPTLGVHIPATGPMDHEACGESFKMAVLFFQKHFPERAWNAFTCHSWLLDPQLVDHLPPAGNVVRFLREWFLFPVPKANAEQHYERIFGWQYAKQPADSILAAPLKTSLQKAIAGHVQAGGHWRMGGAIILPTGLNWGAQSYQNVGVPRQLLSALP